MNEQERKQILHKLKRVQEIVDEDWNKLEYPLCGICANVENDMPECWCYESKRAFASWGHFSGRFSYPVPYPDATPEDDQSWWAKEIYRQSKQNADMWTGRYGELRRDLLRHLIGYFESEVAADERQ